MKDDTRQTSQETPPIQSSEPIVISDSEDGNDDIFEDALEAPEVKAEELTWTQMRLHEDDSAFIGSDSHGLLGADGDAEAKSRQASVDSGIFWDVSEDISSACMALEDNKLETTHHRTLTPLLAQTDSSSSEEYRFSSNSSYASGPDDSSSTSSSVPPQNSSENWNLPTSRSELISSSISMPRLTVQAVISRKRKSEEPFLSSTSRAPSAKVAVGQDVTKAFSSGAKNKEMTELSDNYLSFRAKALDNVSDFVEPVVVADIGRLKAHYDKLSIGTQWEIARLISLGRVNSATVQITHLQALQGSNAEFAPKVVQKLLPQTMRTFQDREFVERAFARENAAKSPYAELDIEELELSKDPFAGLGIHNDWYGGKVQFIAIVQSDPDKKGRFKLVLEPAELGPSSRFTRRFGSMRFIRVRIGQRMLHEAGEKLIPFFCRPFVLCGRIFRAFFAKENNVFLVETAEIYDPKTGGISKGLTKDRWNKSRFSLEDFLEWHNPMTHNQDQTAAKWAARFALGLSNSVPGLLLKHENIEYEDEEISPQWTGSGKPPSEVEMTDGCGFANVAVLQALYQKYQWETFPTALQVRVRGAKGLLVRHPEGWHGMGDPKIYLRPSQIKIKYHPDGLQDPALSTIDVLRSSDLKSPSKLSAETIINLAENGVPHQVFIQLMLDGLKDLVQGLTLWDGSNAMKSLWLNVARVGGVIGQRKARALGGESRARGYGDKDRRDEDDDEDDDADGLVFDRAVQRRSVAWWADEISGCPSSLEETVMCLLDSGFTPRELPVLADKLKRVLTTAIHHYVIRYRIEVPKSCHAWIMPDPLGILEPGQVYIKSSHRLRGVDDIETDVIVGDVLVTRHPCKLPTDVQKVKAIDCPQLSQYINMIIFDIKSHRTLASMLGGGDYDGDKVIAIWQPEIVTRFENADPKYANPPENFKEQFSKNTETVRQLRSRLACYDEAHRYVELQKYLLGPLRDPSIVGRYSNMHDCATYMLGYRSAAAVRLAYMFCAVLDGSKTGLKVRPEVLAADSKDYYKRKPDWKETEEDKQRLDSSTNDLNPRRTGKVSQYTFIMDAIKRQGKASENQYLKAYEELQNNATAVTDAALIAPWNDAHARAKRAEREGGGSGMLAELELIAQHVRAMRERHREAMTPKTQTRNEGFLSSSRKGKHKKASFAEMSIEKRQDVLRDISRAFASKPNNLIYYSERDIKVLRASYAYTYDLQSQENRRVTWTRFPWDVAMRELCAIKAGDASKTVNSDFYYSMSVLSHCKIAI